MTARIAFAAALLLSLAACGSALPTVPELETSSSFAETGLRADEAEDGSSVMGSGYNN